MTQEEKYLQWMGEFFYGEDGETCKVGDTIKELNEK